MGVSADQLSSAIELLLRRGARRIILFGSAADSLERANDLDLAVEGLDPQGFFAVAAEVSRQLGLPVDLIDLGERTPFTEHIRSHGRTLYENDKRERELSIAAEQLRHLTEQLQSFQSLAAKDHQFQMHWEAAAETYVVMLDALFENLLRHARGWDRSEPTAGNDDVPSDLRRRLDPSSIASDFPLLGEPTLAWLQGLRSMRNQIVHGDRTRLSASGLRTMIEDAPAHFAQVEHALTNGQIRVSASVAGSAP